MAGRKPIARALLTLIIIGACATTGGGEATDRAELESALSIVADFIETSNSGDVEATLAFFGDTSGAIEADYLGPEGDRFLSYRGLDGFEWLANRVAAHTLRDNETCSAARESEGVVKVECEYDSAHVVRRAVGASSLETTGTFLIDRGAIVAFEEDIIASGPNVGDAYIGWLAGLNPWDASVAALFEWQSIDQAELSGIAEARHADEYAAYLKENGCDMTGCRPTVSD